MIKIFFSKQSSALDVATGNTTFTNSLWLSDGTVAGTAAIKLGFESSQNPSDHIGDLTAYRGGVALTTPFDFHHEFNSHVGSVWISDGTSDGTALIAHGFGSVGGITAFHGDLFYAAHNFSTGPTSESLWSSDGSSGGTALANLGTDALVTDFVNTGTELFFITNFFGTDITGARNGVYNASLWETDGTAAGTVKLQFLSVNPVYAPEAMTIGYTLYYGSNSATLANAAQLWKITADGTRTMVKDLSTSSGTDSAPRDLTDVHGMLFFTAGDGSHGDELWKSDGTTAGTVMVKDILAGAAGSSPSNLFDHHGTLYFAASDGNGGTDLWTSDGTTAGTAMVGAFGFSDPVNFDGDVYFANNGLWRTDGTSAGTLQVSALDASNLEARGASLFFDAADGSGSFGLYRLDASGIVELTSGVDIRSDFVISDSQQGAGFDGHAYDDVMLQVAGTGQLVFANMENGANAGFGVLTSPLGTLIAVGHADFNGDGIADAVVQDPATDLVLIAEQDGSGSGIPNWVAATSQLKGGGFDFQAVGVGDVTGDGTPDILLQNEGATGDGSILAVTGQSGGNPTFISVAPALRADGAFDFRVVGVGDLNGDGFADVVLQDQDNTGQVLIRDLHDNSFFTLATATGGFAVVGVGDVNGDGHADVILQQAGGGDVLYLDPTGGLNDFKLAVTGIGTTLLVKDVADVDNDGFAEILLQSTVTGEVDYRHVGASDADGFFGLAVGPNGNAFHLV